MGTLNVHETLMITLTSLVILIYNTTYTLPPNTTLLELLWCTYIIYTIYRNNQVLSGLEEPLLTLPSRLAASALGFSAFASLFGSSFLDIRRDGSSKFVW